MGLEVVHLVLWGRNEMFRYECEVGSSHEWRAERSHWLQDPHKGSACRFQGWDSCREQNKLSKAPRASWRWEPKHVSLFLQSAYVSKEYCLSLYLMHISHTPRFWEGWGEGKWSFASSLLLFGSLKTPHPTILPDKSPNPLCEWPRGYLGLLVSSLLIRAKESQTLGHGCCPRAKCSCFLPTASRLTSTEKTGLHSLANFPSIIMECQVGSLVLFVFILLH